jgi:hypothetical protein
MVNSVDSMQSLFGLQWKKIDYCISCVLCSFSSILVSPDLDPWLSSDVLFFHIDLLVLWSEVRFVLGWSEQSDFLFKQRLYFLVFLATGCIQLLRKSWPRAPVLLSNASRDPISFCRFCLSSAQIGAVIFGARSVLLIIDLCARAPSARQSGPLRFSFPLAPAQILGSARVFLFDFFTHFDSSSKPSFFLPVWVAAA